MNIGAIVLGVSIVGIGAWGLFYISAALFSPRWFLRTISFGRRSFKPSIYRGGQFDERWWDYPLGLLTLICLGRVVYCAVYAVTFAIPPDWGGLGEDGDWQSTREYVQYVAAFFGSLFLAERLEKNALAVDQLAQDQERN